MKSATAFAAGLVFGIGLLVSGLADPAKVLGFLNVTAPWDPSLALVMVSAVAFSGLGFTFARHRDRSLLGAPTPQPPTRRIDAPLVAGSVLFGIGWGLAGICPGPSLVLLGTGNAGAIVFVAAMCAGFWAHNSFQRFTRITAAA